MPKPPSARWTQNQGIVLLDQMLDWLLNSVDQLLTKYQTHHHVFVEIYRHTVEEWFWNIYYTKHLLVPRVLLYFEYISSYYWKIKISWKILKKGHFFEKRFFWFFKNWYLSSQNLHVTFFVESLEYLRPSELFPNTFGPLEVNLSWFEEHPPPKTRF